MYRHLSKVVLFSLLGLLTFVYAQETTETSVDPAVRATLDQGKKLLLSSNFEQAAALMRQIVAVDPRNGQAQFYLGLATIGPKKVRRNRDNAAKCFLASAEAGYHLPFGEWENFPVHQGTYIDANWNPAKKIMGEKDPQQLETATHLLENIVSVDHRAHHASERLGELYVDTGQNRKALDLFQRLLEANPDKSESVYDMGLGYMDIYNKERAEAILADLSSEGPEKMTALSKLLMARAFFVIGDNRIASVYYSQCLDDMNEIAAREIYRDIIDIISKNEKQEYKQARTIDQKKAFFRKFWKSRDPLPTTEYNERLVEHYRRLNYSKQNFYIKQTKGYDDRGKIYIKHGEPNEQVELAGNFGLRDNESWLYYKKPDNLLYHFVRKTGSYLIVSRLEEAVVGSALRSAFAMRPDMESEDPGEEILVSTPDLNANFRELLMNRAEIEPFYFRMASQQPDFDDPEYLQQTMSTDFDMEESILMEPGLTVGMRTETYRPDMGVEPLNYYYYTSDFMAVNANSNVNIFYGMPLPELQFKRDILGERVSCECTFAVFDQDWKEVKRVYNQFNYNFKQELDKSNARLMLLDKQNLNLPSGKYHFSVSVKDLGSEHLGIYKGDLDVSHYEPNQFNVSQIILASDITELEDPSKRSKWTRGSLKVMPMPSRTFQRDMSVFVYYEIYFLTPGSDGVKKYNVDFTVEADKLDRNLASKIAASFGKLLSKSQEKGKITMTFDKEGKKDRIASVEWISIDISESPPGEYNLNVTVTDEGSGKKVTRETFFVITK